MKTPTLLLLAAILASSARAELGMPAVFGDHMVLQRDRPLPVWGWADAGAEVVVRFGETSATATADAEGNWRVVLDPLAADATGRTLTVTSGETLRFENVLLGDVWLCSGQSNMDWGLGASDAAEDIAAADHPSIRHFRVGYQFSPVPERDVSGQWSVCTPATAPGFSAVGYYFARRVHAETGVPIGLVTNAVGGTNIELWMAMETLLETPGLEGYAARMRESLAEWRRDLATALPAIERWSAASREALAAGRDIPAPPKWPEYPFGERVQRPRCVTLHHGHVMPLVPMALRGVLWYQGESNADDPDYLIKKRAMIEDWRRLFEHPELPFYYVQLAAWQAPDPNPEGGGWGRIRDLQRQSLSIPHTGMASAIDIGDADDIHPRNKADVGERLALWALARDEGKTDLTVSGPLFREMRVEGDRIRLHFDSLGEGLMIGRKSGRAPTVETPDAPLRRFAIAGADRRWFWAEARIDGAEVVVRSPEVSSPVAVRYAYSSNPEGANLYNRAGLPASPFRTDDW